MAHEALDVKPGPRPRSVRTQDGRTLDVPEGWELLPPGDAGLTRKVKAGGPTWTVKEKRGRKTFSKGVWAPANIIDRARRQMAMKRASPAYQRQLDQARKRRERDHRAYVQQFYAEVLAFLAFDPIHETIAKRLAEAVTAHATPVGSGTVARTKRIEVDERAEAAVIAWMRHQTTAYDQLHIPRVKGRRREVRRALAKRSRELLQRYRDGADIDPIRCPLQTALRKLQRAEQAS